MYIFSTCFFARKIDENVNLLLKIVNERKLGTLAIELFVNKLLLVRYIFLSEKRLSNEKENHFNSRCYYGCRCYLRFRSESVY